MSSIKKAKKAKSSSTSSKRSLERKDISRTWMYIDGALAWTKRQILIPINDQKDVKKDAVFCWWPTILFSSWKSATMSGLMCDMSEVEMPSSTQEALTDQFRVGPRVKIHDIELRPYVTQLLFNLVPRKAALGKRNTMNLRNNVVGHYLGLNYAGREEGEEAQWARISVEDVRGPFRDFTISAMNSTKSILDVRKLTLKESEKVYEKILSQMILALHEASDLMGGKKCQGKQLDVSKLFQEIGIFVEYSLKSQRDRKSTGEWFRDFESQGETQTQSQSQQSQIIGKHTRDSTSFSIAPASRGDSNDDGKSRRNSNAKGDRVGLQPDEFGGNRSSPSSTTIPTNDSNVNKKSPKFSNSDSVEGAKTEIIAKGNELDMKNMHLRLSSETISSDGNKVHRRSQNSPENVVVNNADDVSNMIDEVKTTNTDLLPSSETNFANKNGMLQKSLNAADDSAVDENMNVVDTTNISCTKTMELIGGEDEGKTNINTSLIRVSRKHDFMEVSSSPKTCDSRNKDQSDIKQADKTAPGKEEVYTVMKTNYDGRHQIQSEGNDKEAAAGAHEVGNNSTFKRNIDELYLPAKAGMGASLQADAESENVADVQNQDSMVSSNSEHLFTQQFVDCSDEDNVAHEFAFTQ